MVKRENKREKFYGDCLTLGVIRNKEIDRQMHTEMGKNETEEEVPFLNALGFKKLKQWIFQITKVRILFKIWI